MFRKISTVIWWIINFFLLLFCVRVIKQLCVCSVFKLAKLCNKYLKMDNLNKNQLPDSSSSPPLKCVLFLIPIEFVVWYIFMIIAKKIELTFGPRWSRKKMAASKIFYSIHNLDQLQPTNVNHGKQFIIIFCTFKWIV